MTTHNNVSEFSGKNSKLFCKKSDAVFFRLQTQIRLFDLEVCFDKRRSRLFYVLSAFSRQIKNLKLFLLKRKSGDILLNVENLIAEAVLNVK